MINRFTVITNHDGEFPATSAEYLVWCNQYNEWTIGFNTFSEAQTQCDKWNTEEILKLSPLARRATFKLVS